MHIRLVAREPLACKYAKMVWKTKNLSNNRLAKLMSKFTLMMAFFAQLMGLRDAHEKPFGSISEVFLQAGNLGSECAQYQGPHEFLERESKCH